MTENNRIENYIAEHRLEVLKDSLEDVVHGDLAHLPRLLHRLKGTIGTFDMPVLARALNGVYESILDNRDLKSLESAQQESIKLITAEMER